MRMISIPVRNGSKRLKKKHFQSISDSLSCLDLLLLRLKETRAYHNGALIVLNTTSNAEDKEFGTVAERHGVNVFYGDAENIPLRLFQAMSHFDCESSVNVDGDDLLCPKESIDLVMDELTNGKIACESTGFPLGLNSFGFRMDYLKNIYEKIESQGADTGWKHVFGDELCALPLEIEVPSQDCRENLRFTLDYPEDLLFFQSLYKMFGKSIVSAKINNVIDFVCTNKIYEINRGRIKDYWLNFHG